MTLGASFLALGFIFFLGSMQESEMRLRRPRRSRELRFEVVASIGGMWGTQPREFRSSAGHNAGQQRDPSSTHSVLGIRCV